jgi:hypothetical protein
MRERLSIKQLQLLALMILIPCAGCHLICISSMTNDKSQILNDKSIFSFCFAYAARAAARTTSAQTTQFGEISVRVESIAPSIEYRDVYEEYRATIVNLSSERAHQVILESSISSTGRNNVIIKRMAAVPASSTSHISLFLPQSDADGRRFAVSIDGVLQKDEVTAEVARTGAWIRRANNRVSLLISQRISRSNLMSEAAVEEGLKEAGEIDVAYLPYDVPLDEWSANWLGYTQFDGLVITSDELREMPSGVRTAIWSYLECGGSMLVIGSIEVPHQWEGRRHSIISAIGGKNQLPVHYVGFGILILTGDIDPQQITASQWNDIKSHWRKSRMDDSIYTQLAMIDQEFPVINGGGAPVRGFLILMIVFVIVIGPLNLIWLARRKKKIWWTVPALSLLTALAVSSFALLGDGQSVSARTEAMTILDEVSHRATSLGWLGFYSPAVMAEGLHFSNDTQLILKKYWNLKYGDGPIRAIDWTHDQHLASPWITARVPLYFAFRKSEVRLERLTVSVRENGSIGLLNCLGADIRQLWWADKTGDLYTATNISAGAESRLTPINMKVSGAADGLRNVYTNSWLQMINQSEVNPREALSSGCYLAILDASPFVEEGLRNVNTRKAKSLVYGIQHRR